jgi:hypothetical protein
VKVNNSTNINKTNNNVLPQLDEHIKKTKTSDIGNPCPGLGQAHTSCRVKPVNINNTCANLQVSENVGKPQDYRSMHRSPG